MHYFKFNISDWSLATSHLSLEEQGIYLRLLNFYYDTERPIPLETHWVLRRLSLGSHSDTVGMLLDEFFTPTEQGWVHHRCDDEIERYHQKVKLNQENGKKGGRPARKIKGSRAKNPDGSQTDARSNPDITLTTNHKPITNNQELNTKEKNTKKEKFEPKDFLRSLGADAELVEEWLKVRKEKKLTSTKTAFEAFESEVIKSEREINQVLRQCITRSWGGFKASWPWETELRSVKPQEQIRTRRYF